MKAEDRINTQQLRFLAFCALPPKPHFFTWLVEKENNRLLVPNREPPQQWTHFRVSKTLREVHSDGRQKVSTCTITAKDLAGLKPFLSAFEPTVRGKALLRRSGYNV